jgi:hypothetical protein
MEIKKGRLSYRPSRTTKPIACRLKNEQHRVLVRRWQRDIKRWPTFSEYIKYLLEYSLRPR